MITKAIFTPSLLAKVCTKVWVFVTPLRSRIIESVYIGMSFT